MAVLNRPIILNQQRFDLEDWRNLLQSLLKDAQRFSLGVISDTPCIVSGFYPVFDKINENIFSLELSGGASLIFPKSLAGETYSWFVVPDENDNTYTNTINSGSVLLVAKLKNDPSNPVNKLFYDPVSKKSFTQTSNSTKSVQIEFEKKANTESADTDDIAICEYSFDSTTTPNTLTYLFDKREMLFRRQRTAKATVANAFRFKVGGGYTWANHTAGNDFYVHEIDGNILSITFATHPNFANDVSFVKFIEDFESKPLNLRNILTDLQEKNKRRKRCSTL